MQEGWISPWWQAAVLPERWNVLGWRFRALSLWHTFALESVGNRFWCGGTPDLNDAASLILICSSDYATGRALMVNGYLRTFAMWRIARRLRRMDWEAVYSAICDYVQSCNRTARRWEKKAAGAGKRASVPYQWHLVALLSKSMRPAEAWDQPYAATRCLYDAIAEAERMDDTIMAPHHEQLDDQMYAEEQAEAACRQ